MSVYHLLLCGIFLPGIQSTVTEESGFKGYTKYEHGDMNIIITAPHGGYKRPSTQDNLNIWPDRARYGCKDAFGRCVWMHDCGTTSTDCESRIFNDLHTRAIAGDIADKIKGITGEGYCHLVEKQGFVSHTLYGESYWLAGHMKHKHLNIYPSQRITQLFLFNKR